MTTRTYRDQENTPDERAPIELSVIVPTFNEVENLPVLLPALLGALSNIRAEIIVVDDDSPDGTWRIAEEWATLDVRVRAIRRVSDRGLSSAVLAGMAVARGRAFAVIDSDLQHDERILPLLARPVLAGDADITIGSREAPGGSYGDWSRGRRAVSWTGKQLAQRVVGVGVSDPMSGYFVVSRHWYEDVRERVNPRGFKILLEFLARGGRPRLQEVGYVFRTRERGETKLTGSVIGSFAIALADLFLGRLISSTFMAYAIVGVLGIGVRFAGQATLSAVGFAAAGGAGFVLSVVFNYVLNNRFTFRRYAFTGRAHVRGFTFFLLVSLHGLLVQAGVSTLAADRVGSEAPGAVVLFGIAIATAGNYLLNSTMTWRAHRRAAL